MQNNGHVNQFTQLSMLYNVLRIKSFMVLIVGQMEVENNSAPNKNPQTDKPKLTNPT